MSGFNAKRARAKRPCPLWVDAFQRDTQHLGADEVGAYMLILMAMWTRETCDFPDDDARLAKVSRVSLRLWRTRIGPVLRPLFEEPVDGALRSKRLREEAAYVERQVKAQSDRKTGENPDKPLNDNDGASSADNSVDPSACDPRNHPSQLPNNPTLGEEGSDKSDPPPPSGGGDFDGFVSELAKAVGYDKPPAMWRSKKAKTHIRGWLESHDEDALVDIARRSRETHPEPPETPQALDSFIERDAQKPAPVPPPSLEEKCSYWAEKVNGPGYVSPNAIKPELARDLLRAGLVTPEKLKERGIAA